MNAPQLWSRVLLGTLAVFIGGCANAAPAVSTSTVQMPANATPKATAYQWVDFGMYSYQYDYPKSTSPTGKKVDLYDSNGQCTAGDGTFWIVNTEGEYADEHSYSGKLIRYLYSSGSSSFNACAVSATTGDIAFTTSANQIVVFKGGSQQKASTYPISQAPFRLGYDRQNNLYVDAMTPSKAYVLLELSSASTSFQSVSLPNALLSAGSIQWDGNYVALADNAARKIYRYTITGYAATLEGTVSLDGKKPCWTTWIATPYLFCSGIDKRASAVYNYPAGGHAIASFKGAYGGSVIQVTK